MIFSWAENKNGHMVHVDNVPQGLACNCVCPKCRERLLARHGEIRHHGFAHHSETRGANLKICYMVTLYKLAEQIVLLHKQIQAPSYYGIFKESVIKFSEVQIDSSYDRIDKQPDIIATTIEGKQYLIEFNFAYKVQRKEAIDYKNLNCLEIDLSNQTLESLESFLLNSSQNRKWLNNEEYFRSIERLYQAHGKIVRLTEETSCNYCDIKYNCCAITLDGKIINITNNGNIYRLCKPELLARNKERCYKKRLDKLTIESAQNKQQIPQETTSQIIPPENRTCFMCKSNLDWMCQDRQMAHCGPYPSMGVPRNTPPETAKTCKGFKPKS